MMSYTIECPFCRQRIEVPDELDGSSANCPGCSNELYLTRDDAVEDLDPGLASMRREHEAREREHLAQLREVMKLQEQHRSSMAVVKWIVYIFVVFPLAIWLLIFFVSFLLRCFGIRM